MRRKKTSQMAMQERKNQEVNVNEPTAPTTHKSKLDTATDPESSKFFSLLESSLFYEPLQHPDFLHFDLT